MSGIASPSRINSGSALAKAKPMRWKKHWRPRPHKMPTAEIEYVKRPIFSRPNHTSDIPSSHGSGSGKNVSMSLLQSPCSILRVSRHDFNGRSGSSTRCLRPALSGAPATCLPSGQHQQFRPLTIDKFLDAAECEILAELAFSNETGQIRCTMRNPTKTCVVKILLWHDNTP